MLSTRLYRNETTDIPKSKAAQQAHTQVVYLFIPTSGFIGFINSMHHAFIHSFMVFRGQCIHRIVDYCCLRRQIGSSRVIQLNLFKILIAAPCTYYNPCTTTCYEIVIQLVPVVSSLVGL
jgi:hypothetical protein